MNITERTLQLKEDFDKVYEKGKKDEYGSFWDVYQGNGKRTNYYRAFANQSATSSALGWSEITFKPKYDMRPTTMAQGFTYLNVGDLEKHFNECGIIFDTQNCTNFSQAFSYSYITTFPVLHFKVITDASQIFASCVKLHTIRKIIFESGANTAFSSAFSGCSALSNIDEIEGSIERNISFSSSPLTADTIKRIISCLKDYSGTDSEYSNTLTLKSSAFSKLETGGATAEYNGEACTWAELVDNKKWNLTLS